MSQLDQILDGIATMIEQNGLTHITDEDIQHFLYSKVGSREMESMLIEIDAINKAKGVEV